MLMERSGEAEREGWVWKVERGIRFAEGKLRRRIEGRGEQG